MGTIAPDQGTRLQASSRMIAPSSSHSNSNETTEMNAPTQLTAPWEINKCVRVPAGDVFLLGEMQIPEECRGLVIFAFGSGRSRNNPRARHTAQVMRLHGIGTLLCELLTEEEELEDEASENFRHDADLLARRLVEVTEWAATEPDARNLKLGYFGACAGGAAALIAAVRMKGKVRAVVSRGGRMDLAAKCLPRVKCPTLLIVGENDPLGMELNRAALGRLCCEKQLLQVPGASYLFGEPGKLGEMANLSAEWFFEHLRQGNNHR
jgi:putative phosphoribosyl transferase